MRGDERADARFVEQSGADLADDRKHRELEFAAFGRQLLDPGRRAAQGQFGGGVLGLGSEVPFLIAMSLFVSGVATFIQCRRIGPVGSGLLSLQGTSFAFLGAILAAGFAVKGQGGTPEDILAMIFGLCLVGCLVEIVLSQFIDKLGRIITPTVTGIVITIIGLSLVKVGFTDFAGGATAGDSLGAPLNRALRSQQTAEWATTLAVHASCRYNMSRCCAPSFTPRVLRR